MGPIRIPLSPRFVVPGIPFCVQVLFRGAVINVAPSSKFLCLRTARPRFSCCMLELHRQRWVGQPAKQGVIFPVMLYPALSYIFQTESPLLASFSRVFHTPILSFPSVLFSVSNVPQHGISRCLFPSNLVSSLLVEMSSPFFWNNLFSKPSVLRRLFSHPYY